MLIVIIIVSRTITVGNIELNDIAVDQIQSLICAKVNRKIVPTGLFVLIYESRCGSNSINKCIGNRSACANIFAIVIEHERIYSVTNPCGNILIGNIYPHTKASCILKFLLSTLVLKRCHHISRFKRVTVVDIERHSAVAAVNLAVCGCYGIYSSVRQYIVICNIAEVEHACIAVFKIEDNLRAFAEFDI